MPEATTPMMQFTTEEAAAFKEHLGWETTKMDLLIRCTAILARAVYDRYPGTPNFLTALHAEIPKLLMGVLDTPGTQLASCFFGYVYLAKTSTGGTVLVFEAMGKRYTIDMPEAFDHLWLTSPEMAIGPLTKRPMHLLLPALLPCHHVDKDLPNCGPGVDHKGLFYLEDGKTKYNAFNKAMGLEAPKTEKPATN